MSIQYISDQDGKTTGVIVPIDEWNELISELENSPIPTWQWEKIMESKKLMDKNSQLGTEIGLAISEVEKELNL
ncbi:MAG: hypothetical protein ACJAWV_003269 [Flammeovirgaceae bacterium]|jgi:hypothetical protein